MTVPVVKGRIAIGKVKVLAMAHIDGGARLNGDLMQVAQVIGECKNGMLVVVAIERDDLVRHPRESMIVPVVPSSASLVLDSNS
jgi:hypothetical protein